MHKPESGNSRAKPTTPNSSATPFRDVLAERVSRRAVLKGGATAASLAIGAGFVGSVFEKQAHAGSTGASFSFDELKRIYDQTHHVAPGYKADILIRWGDKVAADAPDFDPTQQSVESQSKQFGYNCDYIAYFPLPIGSDNSDHGLLFIHHEYPNPHVMFPGYVAADAEVGKTISKEHADVSLASVGHSVIEIEKKDGQWRVVEGSQYGRRISALTPMTITGPAAGHALMKTSADATGTSVIGTAMNCSGGRTPWGTALSSEEWAYSFFGGEAEKTAITEHLNRSGMWNEDYYGAARHHDRFNVEKEPNELNRWQWAVEVDPYDPSWVPVKRTALGRGGCEGANTTLNKDGRVVVYRGDDDYFEYLYRFVSDGTYDPNDRTANRDLLDKGVLAAARFDADGTLTWLPLVHGQNGLTSENGFADQGEVLIKTRQAADKLGATPMDRPEDFEVNPVTGRVYAVMTKNKKRKADGLNPVNSRAENHWGQIVELIPPGEGKDADHAADSFKWDILVLCGDPSKKEHGATFPAETSADGWFVTPDNIAFDHKGRLWVATDGQNDFEIADGLFAVETSGPLRGLPRALFAAPFGAEVSGPMFTPDGKTLFLAVQHPAEDSETIEKLTTRWPDFKDGMPARPAVVVITREDGGEIGG
ncbi:MAG: PhoX family protein [Dongiaceae bacterium]